MEMRFSKTHEWARKEGDLYVCGLSNYAQEKVGDIVFVELPECDSETTQGESFGVIESVKAANDIYSPLTGTILEVNETLEDEPELLNSSAEDQGWICKIKGDESSFLSLMSFQEYQKFLEEDDD